MPRGSVSRTARLASLPLGAAGRATLGLGQAAVRPAAEAVTAELQQRTAEQLFAVLGQLKGGAMKLGQTLSVFEAAVPEEIAGALPRGADQAAGGGAADAGAHRARGARPAARRHAGATRFREFDDAAGRRGQHRAGAPRDLAGRPRRRGQDPVPGRRRPR